MLPETKQLPLEEMNKLFTESPWFVGNSSGSQRQVTEASLLARRIEKDGIEGRTSPAEHLEQEPERTNSYNVQVM